MTLSLLALWFLILERRRVGGENPGGDSVAGAGDLHPAAAVAGPGPGADRGGVSRVLWRKEESRIYQWHKATGTFPPRRSRPDTSTIDPTGS